MEMATAKLTRRIRIIIMCQQMRAVQFLIVIAVLAAVAVGVVAVVVVVAVVIVIRI